MSKRQENKRIYVKYIETLVNCGYDITPFLNPKWNSLDYDKIQMYTKELEDEHLN